MPPTGTRMMMIAPSPLSPRLRHTVASTGHVESARRLPRFGGESTTLNRPRVIVRSCLIASVRFAGMPEHQYEAHCECGAEWRLLLEEDDDPMAECLNCGADCFDLTDIGEPQSAGPGTV